MKNCIFALPALLRASAFLAIASPSTFNVQDDLLAFPQYTVDYSEDYLTESQAEARLHEHRRQRDAAASHLEQYRSSDDHPRDDERKAREEVDYSYEPMTIEGQRYVCAIPHVEEPEVVPGANDTLSKADEEKELARAKDRGWELLSGMEGNCVYFLSGWWSYKFCYNDIVRQFHQLPPSAGVNPWPPREDPGEQGYTLGKYSPNEEKGRIHGEVTVSKVGGNTEIKETDDRKLVQRGDSRYLVQTLHGGTLCDLTRKGRRTEVQFHCNPQSPDRISLIKETSTCDYLMVIQTARLCQDVAFLPPQTDAPNEIICTPILNEDEVDDYKYHMSSMHQKSKAAASAAAAQKPYPPLRQMVGDIEIGGHNIVPPDVKLERSAIVGGGKEVYVATIASSAGKLMGKEELERLGFGNPQEVAKLKKQLELMAKGDEWKLDVIEGPKGLEYKGVIGSSEEGDDKEGKGEEAQKGESTAEKKEKAEEKGEEREGSQEQYIKDEL